MAAMAILIAVVWRERAKVLGISLSVWFVLVILYDLLVFDLSVAGAGVLLKTLLLVALLLNPIDAARVFYLLATGVNGFVGATGAVLAETLGSPLGMALLVGVLVAWTLGALAAARLVFNRCSTNLDRSGIRLFGPPDGPGYPADP